MLRQRIAPGWLFGLVLSVCGWTALAAPPRLPTPTRTGAASPPAEWHVAILGEIQRPGVYRIVGRTVTLQELVTKARGFTPAASTLIRRIRGGEPGNLFPFHADGRDSIQDGDVYQVEREPSLPVGRNNRGIHVALVGVLNRPVVQEVPPHRAETLELIKQFGLSSEAARQVRVIDYKMKWDPGQGTVEPLSLDNGSVVVFQTGLFAGRKLPVLSAAIEFDRNQQAGPTATGSAEPREPSPVTAVAGQLEPDLPPLPAPVESETSAAPDVVSADLQAPAPAAMLGDFPPAPTPQPPARIADQPALPDPAHDLAAAFGEEDFEVPEEAASPISVWHMVGILGAVAGLLGMALVVRKVVGAGGRDGASENETDDVIRSSELPAALATVAVAPVQSAVAPIEPIVAAVTPPPVTPPPVTPPPVVRERDELATRLQQLLDNAVPIREEPLELPDGLRLDGWLSAAAVAHRHAEHEPIPRPRFLSGRVRGGRRAERVDEFLEAAARPTAKAGDDDEGGGDDPAAARALILERLRQATDLRTPLDRALQQLQGGGR